MQQSKIVLIIVFRVGLYLLIRKLHEDTGITSYLPRTSVVDLKKMLITATDGILMSANEIVKRTLVITDSLRGRLSHWLLPI